MILRLRGKFLATFLLLDFCLDVDVGVRFPGDVHCAWHRRLYGIGIGIGIAAALNSMEVGVSIILVC